METKKRALVVDDEEVVCRSVKRILEKKNLEVDAALNATEALEKIAKEDYGVVITDLMMPKITGMELLKRIKKSKPEIPVIMITGYATIRTAVQAIKLGAFDYIPKPFTPEELSSVTIRALERERIYKEEAEEMEEAVEKIKPSGEAPREAPAAIGVVEEEVIIEGDLYCMPEHSWARVGKDGNVTVGMEEMFRRTAGDIVNIDLPFEGDDVHQGDVCVRVTSHDRHIHKLWSPITGKVLKVNEALSEDCSPLKRDPRGAGWLIIVAPANLEEDLENLIFIKPAIREDA
jgi:FixJ family two-component response regulator/glycine cleavage system H lipoate-binding protein